MVFNERNGLRANTEYQVVLHVRAKTGLTLTDPPMSALQIWSMDDVLLNPFDVVEVGKAPSSRVVASGEAALKTSDPQFLEGGLVLENTTTNGLVELKGKILNLENQ